MDYVEGILEWWPCLEADEYVTLFNIGMVTARHIPDRRNSKSNICFIVLET